MGSVRILYHLAQKEEVNITAISRNTKLNHVRVTEILAKLKRDGIVQEKIFGRIKIYSINPSNEAGKRISQFLRDWDRDVFHIDPDAKEN